MFKFVNLCNTKPLFSNIILNIPWKLVQCANLFNIIYNMYNINKYIFNKNITDYGFISLQSTYEIFALKHA